MRCWLADGTGSCSYATPKRRRLVVGAGLAVLLAIGAGRASAQTFTNLLSFSGAGGAYPGADPLGSLTLSGTTLYGMTFEGGSGGIGTVFSVGTNGSGFQNLLSFSGAGGAYPGESPVGSLTLSGATLYGMTAYGGSGGIGTLFSVGTNGSGFQNLLSFSGSGGAYPGWSPFGNLTLSGTTLYGMTQIGGSSANGNVFSVGVNGSGFQNLLSFSGAGGAYPGYDPPGSLTLSGTTFYGMTSAVGYGNVFSVGANGSGFQNLVYFSGLSGAYPGVQPDGSLTLSGTTLYGMTSGFSSGGRTIGYGNVFSVGTNGSGFQSLVSFTGAGGAYPGANPWAI